MARQASELARRFKATLDRQSAARAAAEEERQRRLEAGREARERLFDELAAFGEAVGHLVVSRTGEGVRMRFGDREIGFEAMGEGDRVRLAFEGAGEGEEHRLFRHPDLLDRWVWSIRKGEKEELLPLFDQGLEEMMVRVLGLPRPGQLELDDLFEPGDQPVAERAEDPKKTL